MSSDHLVKHLYLSDYCDRAEAFRLLQEIDLALDQGASGVDVDGIGVVQLGLESILLIYEGLLQMESRILSNQKATTLQNSKQDTPHPWEWVRFSGLSVSQLTWMQLSGFEAKDGLALYRTRRHGVGGRKWGKADQESFLICPACRISLRYRDQGLHLCQNCGAHFSIDENGRTAYYEPLGPSLSGSV